MLVGKQTTVLPSCKNEYFVVLNPVVFGLSYYFGRPVAAGVNAEPLVQYEGGIVFDNKVWNMMVRPR